MRSSSLLVFLAVLLVVGSPLVAQSVTATTNLQSRIIETFDDPDESPWAFVGSRFLTESLQDQSNLQFIPNAFPAALYRNPPNPDELLVLGHRFAFDRRGYNFIEYYPAQSDGNGGVELDDNGVPIPRAIPIPGQVRNLDMWVWGSNHDYYLEVHLRDFRGIVHVIRLGDVGFSGWQNLRVNIPTSIPQTVQYLPQRKGLELVKIVLWTRPEERVAGFPDAAATADPETGIVPLFIYFDEIKVFSDVFEQPFDGDALTDPNRINEIWNAPQGGGQ